MFIVRVLDLSDLNLPKFKPDQILHPGVLTTSVYLDLSCQKLHSSRSPGEVVSQKEWVQVEATSKSCSKMTGSLDWFKGKSTGNHGSDHQI